MIDLKRYNYGTMSAVAFALINILLYFTPFITTNINGHIVPNSMSAYELFKMILSDQNPLGVGALIFNDYTSTGIEHNIIVYFIAILALIFLCISVLIAVLCIIDLLGHKANKRLVSHLSYIALFILLVIVILVVVRIQYKSGLVLGYGLVISIVGTSLLSLFRYLKIQ